MLKPILNQVYLKIHYKPIMNPLLNNYYKPDVPWLSSLQTHCAPP